MGGESRLPSRFLLSFPSFPPAREGVRISGARGSVYVAPDSIGEYFAFFNDERPHQALG